ncbi:MAG: hypothetical protein HQK87_03150, partial [Nitrospinae bacterium]|nr:hypothetical protein [Nitrospinota bacterium]
MAPTDGNEGKKKFRFMWWPHYVGICIVAMLLVTGLIVLLATIYPVPDDAPNEIPYPDHG